MGFEFVPSVSVPLVGVILFGILPGWIICIIYISTFRILYHVGIWFIKLVSTALLRFVLILSIVLKVYV